MTPSYKRQSIRAAMAAWPRVSSDTCRWLESLPFRYRRAVILHMGEGRTIEATAAALGVSVQTVYNDLRECCGARELMYMPGDTLEHLVVAVLKQAIRDGRKGGVGAYDARAWLMDDPLAAALFDLLGMNRERVCVRLFQAEDLELAE